MGCPVLWGGPRTPPSSSARAHGSLLPTFLSPAWWALLWLRLWDTWVPGQAGLPISPAPTPTAGIYKGFCLDVIRNKYECELQGAKQHLEVNVTGCWGGVGG